jgi:hypothetical protein
MKTKWFLIIICCLAGTLSFGQNQNPNLDSRQQAMEEAANSPINFWGKVVDQNGNPISDATVTFTLTTQMFSDDDTDNKVVVRSDASGLFSLTGKKGVGISVWVAKEGYYSISDAAGVSVNYFLKAKNPSISFRRSETNEPYPTAQQPTIFTLTKKGRFAASLVRKHVRLLMPKDGTPVEINLALGRVASVGQGDLKVQSWVTDNGKDVVHPYPWKCLVTVPGGGLQLRSGKLKFQAPTGNYQPTDEVTMSGAGDHWSRDMNREYFLQLSGNRYVRMRFEMVSGGNNILNLDYDLNTKPGDTNLESAKWSAAE